MKPSFEQIRNKALKLVADLEKNCTEKTICENYGQKEISKFKDKYLSVLSYQESCHILDILYKVKDIEPTY